MAGRPHIVIFNPDQYRGDVLNHLGNPAAVTPTLDRIVRTEAVSFGHAYCQAPVCTPSRCSFMSGWYPHVRGHRTMYHMLRPDEPVLLQSLRQGGYFVWWGGKNDLVPAQRGYDDYCDVRYIPPPRPQKNSYLDQQLWRGRPDSDTYYSFYIGKLPVDEDRGVFYDHDYMVLDEAIRQIREGPKDKPMCLFLALGWPHPPYCVEEPWYSMIDRSKLPVRIAAPVDWLGKPSILKGIYQRQKLQSWDEQRWTELRATYYGMCARVDHQFSLLVEALKEAGIYDDTAIFFFSDHGDFTGNYGLVEKNSNTFEDCLTRVPLIIKPPADVPVKPRVSQALVELVDVPATIEELAGLSRGQQHFGRSLLEALAGQTEEHRDAVFCEGGRLHQETYCADIANNLGEASTQVDPSRLYWPRLSLQAMEGAEHTKAVMCRTKQFKYVRRMYESDELYNLRSDPAELHNRIDDPELADVLADLKEQLLSFYLETADVVPHDRDRRL